MCTAHNLPDFGVIRSQRVASILYQIDRRDFCRNPEDAYGDHPVPIGKILLVTLNYSYYYEGFGQTISAPHMHALCLELLEGHLHDGAKVLDVGAGSGYLAAAMAIMVTILNNNDR